MKPGSDPHFRRDLLKLTYLITALIGTTAVFVITPSLSSPTLISLVISTLLSPWVASFERKGYSKIRAICFIFLVLGIIGASIGLFGVHSGLAEWNSIEVQAPLHFQAAFEKLKNFEMDIKKHYPILEFIHPTDSLLQSCKETGNWFVKHGPGIMGNFLSWIFTIPFLTFVFLNEGRTIRRGFYQLVPNRYFEYFFLITTQIRRSISDYIQAKLIEAILVGTMVTVGLTLIHAPYAIVLGFSAGVTNIVPYIGPFLGAVPAILTTALDTQHSGIAISMTIVFIIANLIDLLVIFPLVVAKLVKLHPVILIAVAAVGEQYYGLVGILVSVPITAALKVIVHEIYIAVYEQRSPALDQASLQVGKPL